MGSRIWLLAGAAAMVGASAAPASGAEAWKSDAPTCTGVYQALAEQKDSLLALSPLATATPGFRETDFAARAARLRSANPPDPEGIMADPTNLYRSAFVMRLAASTIDNDPAPAREVLELARRCDQAHGMKPELGPAGGPPKPAPAPAPKPAPPPPVAQAPRPLTMNDRGCAVAYLALAIGNQGDQQLAQALMVRAQTAGGRHHQANPKLVQADLVKDIQGSAETRVKAIVGKTLPLEPLVHEAQSCDLKYGYPPPPVTPPK